MKIRKIVWLLAAGTAIAWLGGVSVSKVFHSAAYADTGPVAFTAESTVKLYDQSNLERSSSVELHARRSDGSSVYLRKALNNQEAGVKKIIDAKTGKWTTVDPATKSLVTYELGKYEKEHLTSSKTDCAMHPEIKRDPQPQPAILGFENVRFHGTLDGQVIDRWYVPSLSCLVIREEVAASGYKSVRITSSVKLGEPDPSLFTIPGDYVDRSPSEVLSLGYQKDNPGKSNPRTGPDLDSVYWNRKSTR